MREKLFEVRLTSEINDKSIILIVFYDLYWRDKFIKLVYITPR
ncbi:hypothetical protein DFP83_10862 [Idiomarina fontislapidosi]|nr:hypothetical protein DFP83_10862 [Idiomarina fontislapidosi]